MNSIAPTDRTAHTTAVMCDYSMAAHVTAVVALSNFYFYLGIEDFT